MEGLIVSGARERRQATLAERAMRAASGLSALGVGDDDGVAMVLRNDFAFFEAAIAAQVLGAYPVPLNWHNTAEEAGYIFRDCGAKAIIVHADLLPQIEAGIPDGVPVFVVPTPPEVAAAYGIPEARCAVPAGRQEWGAWLTQQPVWTVAAKPLRGSMIYTSGTTGRPKGVRRAPPTPEMGEVAARMFATIFGFRPGEAVRTVITGPVYHSAPNAYAMVSARDAELTVLQVRFDPEQLLQLIERHRISHLYMVPTMFVRLLKLPEAVRQRYDVSSLRFVIHAAAPCPASVKQEMIRWWGPIINEFYGATETGGAFFHTAEEALRKPGTVGRVIAGATVKILDAQGRVLGPHEIGEVYMRIGGVADFTYNGLDDKRQEIERDGLLTAGDVGYLDEEGYLFLCDRVRDMVISGGVNIYPAEIEGVLITMPGVKDCAVFGIPDEEFGEALCAYVEPQDGVALGTDDIRAFLRPHLAAYKIPKRIEFHRDLPREDSGKIFKRRLRAPYWEGLGRQI